MRVTTQDGATFSGDTPEQIVSQMRRDNWSAPPKKREYMEEVAERVIDMTGSVVRADTATNFLNDLQDSGFLKIEDGDIETK